MAIVETSPQNSQTNKYFAIAGNTGLNAHQERSFPAIPKRVEKALCAQGV